MDNSSKRIMGYLYNYLTFTFMIFTFIQDLSALTVSSKSQVNGFLGDNQAALECTYTVATGDQVFSIDWKRKVSGSSDYLSIATFSPPGGAASIVSSTEGQAVSGRVNLTNPTAGSLTATVTFTSIVCADERDYQCAVVYKSSAGTLTATSDTLLKVYAKPLQPNSLVMQPSANIEENQQVTFTCSGNIGRPGTESKYVWTKYRGSVAYPISPVSTTPTQVGGDCTFNGVSRITIPLTREDNQAVIRCTVESTRFTDITNLYKQTDHINVYYQARTPTITRDPPNQSIFYAGESTLTLTCESDANPNATLKWLSPNGTEISSSDTYVFSTMAIDQTGTYTCVAENTYNGKTFNATNTVEIKIDPPTTVPPTTTPLTTPETTDSGNGGGNTGGQKEDTGGGIGDTEIIIIVVVLVVVVVVVAVVIFVCLRMRNQKGKEIDEPPEKPRNNQNLSFVNRPDIVNNDFKNKNAPFNNQFDKGSNNQLAYADLSFDSNGSALNLSNKPRSRMPIQLYDNDLDRDLDGPPTTYSEVNIMPAHLPRV